MDRVDDEEILFRRVLNDTNQYHVEDDEVRVSATAFNDRQKRPSVDRKRICKTPIWTQQGAEHGVLRITAAQVRGIDSIEHKKKGEQFSYAFDVHPDPIVDPPKGERPNPSHAEIRPNPDFKTNSPFKKLKERLAILAEWEILPAEARGTSLEGTIEPPIVASPDTESATVRRRWLSQIVDFLRKKLGL